MLVLSVVTVVAVLKAAQAKTNYAYVANYYPNTVSVINISNNTVVKTIPVGTNIGPNPSSSCAVKSAGPLRVKVGAETMKII